MLDSLESGQIKTSDGLVRRMNHYNEKNELDWYRTYTYDSQDRESLVTSFDGSGNQTGQVQCEYDEQGHEITGYYYHGDDGSIGWKKDEYDNKGTLVKRILDDGDYTIFEYDENGNIGGLATYSKNGEKLCSNVWKREGKLEIIEYYDKNDKKDETEVLERDDYGNVISSSYYDTDNSLIGKTVYSYDKDGKLISQTDYDGNGNITGKTEYDK